MARIRPARGGQDRGDGSPPAPGGARPPAPRRRTPATQPAAKATPQPRPTQPTQRRTEKPGSVTKAVQQQRRSSRFIHEVIAELKKVSWPTRTQLMQSTAVVLVVVAIVAVYLWVLDSIFQNLVDALF